MKEQKEEIVTVRLAVKGDLRWIKRVNESCLSENYDERLYINFFYNYPGLVWVAEHKKKIIGYIMVELRGLKIMRAHIWSIAVMSKFRGHGIGTNLMNVVETQLVDVHNIQFITLHVRQSNIRGLRLYASTMKYNVKQSIPEYYDDKESAVYMVKYFVKTHDK